MNLMVNNSLAINVRLSDDDDSTTSKTDLRSDRNTVSNRDLSLAKEGIRKGGMDNGNMTLLTIADEEEMIHLFTSMNASGSDTGLMSCEEGMLAERKRTVSAESARIARGGDPLLASIAVSAIGLGQGLGQGAGGGLDFPPNFNNPSSNSSSSSSGSSSGSPGNIHPDLKELISALDPTLSLEELSVSLEQPLREVCNAYASISHEMYPFYYHCFYLKYYSYHHHNFSRRNYRITCIMSLNYYTFN